MNNEVCDEIKINLHTLECTEIPKLNDEKKNIPKRKPVKKRKCYVVQQIHIQTQDQIVQDIIDREVRNKLKRINYVIQHLRSVECAICGGKYSMLGSYSYFKKHESTQKHQNALCNGAK